VRDRKTQSDGREARARCGQEATQTVIGIIIIIRRDWQCRAGQALIAAGIRQKKHGQIMVQSSTVDLEGGALCCLAKCYSTRGCPPIDLLRYRAKEARIVLACLVITMLVLSNEHTRSRIRRLLQIKFTGFLRQRTRLWGFSRTTVNSMRCLTQCVV